MTPTPAQISRILALPLPARQRLAEQEGVGSWVSPRGSEHAWDGGSDWVGPYRSTMLEDGHAWLPADSAALMRAATPEGCVWTASYDPRGFEHWTINRRPGRDGSAGYDLADERTALDCALTALAATYGGPDAR